MPELTPLLERAAAKPRRAPEVDQTWRHARSRVLLVRGGALIAIVCFAGVLAVTTRPNHTARVTTATPTTVVPATSEYRDDGNGFSVTIPNGWYRSRASLAPNSNSLGYRRSRNGRTNVPAKKWLPRYGL